MLFEAVNSLTINVISQIHGHLSRLDWRWNVSFILLLLLLLFGGGRGRDKLFQLFNIDDFLPATTIWIKSGLEVSLRFNNPRKKANWPYYSVSSQTLWAWKNWKIEASGSSYYSFIGMWQFSVINQLCVGSCFLFSEAGQSCWIVIKRLQQMGGVVGKGEDTLRQKMHSGQNFRQCFTPLEGSWAQQIVNDLPFTTLPDVLQFI